MTTLTPETLYASVESRTREVQKLGLRETLRQMDHDFSDREIAADAVRKIYTCAQTRKNDIGLDHDNAAIISREAIDAAYQLRCALPRS